MIEAEKLKLWQEDLEKLISTLRSVFGVQYNITRAMHGKEKRRCLLLNQIDVLEKFISALIKNNESTIQKQIDRWNNEIKYMVTELEKK